MMALATLKEDNYIHFKDDAVLQVLLANGVGDGIGVTYDDAAKVTTISVWFQGNTGITAFSEFVNFSGITTLPKNAFNGYSALTEIAFPASLTTILNAAFKGCSSLKRVYDFENTQVTSIKDEIFNNCPSLAEIVFPASLTSIGSYAFGGCSALAEIALPASLTSIDNYSFQYCTKLKTMTVNANTPPTLGSAAIPTSIEAIYVPDESIEAYQAATNWSSFASKIRGISEMPTE